MDWVQVRIPKELADEVLEILRKTPFWTSDDEFIRDAVREKIHKIQAQEQKLEQQKEA